MYFIKLILLTLISNYIVKIQILTILLLIVVKRIKNDCIYSAEK